MLPPAPTDIPIPVGKTEACRTPYGDVEGAGVVVERVKSAGSVVTTIKVGVKRCGIDGCVEVSTSVRKNRLSTASAVLCPALLKTSA